MVIRDFDVERVTAAPFETDSPLVIDSDAILTGTISLEFFKSVTRRSLQVLQILCTVEIDQSASGDPLDICRQFF